MADQREQLRKISASPVAHKHANAEPSASGVHLAPRQAAVRTDLRIELCADRAVEIRQLHPPGQCRPCNTTQRPTRCCSERCLGGRTAILQGSMSAISRAVGRFFGYFASMCMISSRSSLLRFARSGFGLCTSHRCSGSCGLRSGRAGKEFKRGRRGHIDGTGLREAKAAG